MKLVLVSSVPPPIGGISKWTKRMLETKLPNNWEICLVSDRIIGDRVVFGDNTKYNLWNEIKRWLSVWINLYKSIRKKDVVLGHLCPIATTPSMLVNIISSFIIRLCNKKVVIHFRCTVPNLIHSNTQRLLLKLLCKLSNSIIVLNSQTKQYIEKISNSDIYYIPNFIDIREINRKHTFTNESFLTALYVGGVIPEKGCDHIIELAKKTPNVQFRLVGSASSDIIELATDISNIALVGVKNGDELRSEFDNADFFIFLSRYPGEGFSNSLTEAMAAGLPCIVTDWAANADQIDDCKGGFVVSGNIIFESMSAIQKLSDMSLREKQSNYNINKVLNLYSVETIVKQYTDCYDHLQHDKI